MDINGKEYTEITKDLFLCGMYCCSDIYLIHHATKPVLLCSKSIINDSVMHQLRFICESDTKIYVQKDAAESMQEQYQYVSEMNKDLMNQFSDIREEFWDVMNEVANTSRVNMKMVVPMVLSMNDSIKKMDISFLLQWTGYMRSIDCYLQTHSTNVAIICGKLAEWIGMNEEQIKKAVMVGLLHDLGKTKIPAVIIDKPGKLSKEEFSIMKSHSVYSWKILKDSGIDDVDILAGVRGHHEKMNGSGYPDHLKINEISNYAMICGIADIYDAMIAKRTYKEASTPFEILDDFYKMRFAELNTDIVNIFINHMRNELVGKNVILSNGRMASICYIEEGKFQYPIVKIGERVVQLDQSLWCVMLCTKTGII